MINAMNPQITGVGTALITPFDAYDNIDYTALKWLIESQIKGGVNFLVPCGTTGESPTLTTIEHIEIIRRTVEFAKGEAPVVAGTGSNNTREAIELTMAAKKIGADAALVVTPYYNKPTPAGLYAHYEALAKIGIPIILYDIPGRTGSATPTELIIQLAKEKIIAGIKWASGDFSQAMRLRQACPPDFKIFSGDDKFTLPLMAIGGDGVISVASNIIPQSMALAFGIKLTDLTKDEHYKWLNLFEALFLETNPGPVKAALAMMYPKIFSEKMRLPMAPMAENKKSVLRQALKEYRLW